MPDSTLELLVVSYFGSDVSSIRELLDGQPWRVRHTRDLAALKVELARARPHLVIVDRWLLRDEAPDCVNLTRSVHRIPGLLMVAENELLGGNLDFPEIVDGVLEKPLRREPLLEQLNRLAASSAAAPETSPAPETAREVVTSTEPISGPATEPVADTEEEADPAVGPSPAQEGDPSEAETPRPAMNGLERTLGVARLLDEVRETLRRLGDVIQVDSISGLLFRDFFLERAQRETKRAARYGEPLAALMIDIDEFKAVNDGHGHDAGNEVIATLGGIVAGSIRRDLDLACRLHGDEFAILLPCTSLEGARALGERLMQRVNEAASDVAFSVSVGAHALSGDALDEEGLGVLLQAADRALLEAKRRGKGQIFPSSPGQPEPAETAAETAASPNGLLPTADEAALDLGGDVAAPPAPIPAPCPGAPLGTEAPGLPVDAEPVGMEMERDGAGAHPSSAAADADATEDDALAAALAEAAAVLAREEDLRGSNDFRGKALLVSAESEVAEILAGFLRQRGLPVEVTTDLASALTLLDSLEFFLVMADAAPASAEARAFHEAAGRIDSALQVFLFVGEDEEPPEEPETVNLRYVRKPFLLSELYLQATRAREDYHLRQSRD